MTALPPQETASRQTWMAILARASAAELEPVAACLAACTRLRGPEVGLVMVEGRAGGTGAAFNLGEATVARCSVQDGAGRVGHAYRLGRDLRAAELSASLDAALQDPAQHADLWRDVIEPLGAAQAAARARTARQAAATHVQFFTMATMRS